MEQILNGKEIVLGTCYYPEHWPKEMWKVDMERMLECGIKVVRVAEFAWSKIELTEGVFTYTFFDEFLDIAEEVGMKVIFSTPTATPPVWLTEKYPEVLNADINGTLYRHGMRRHYNYNSSKYKELCSRIVEKSASHYAKRSCIIGWQIDNEFNCEINVFYSESDTLAFRKFLHKKYESLDALNDAWGTVFWNQTYTEWEEIYIPRRTISNSTNPHQMLDYYRFISDSTVKFAGFQADILKKYIKEGDFITTNGMFGHLDNHKMTRESLDFITYDSYPNFAYSLDGYDKKENAIRDRMWSRNLSEIRSISPIFGIMEQQSGANGWNTHMASPTPKPGQMTLWTMQSIAHGADFINFFRWRTATIGTEIYWHGILDYSGRDNRRIREVKDIYKKTKALEQLSGGIYEAKVAVLRDYDNIWDAEIDVWHGSVEWKSQLEFFEAAQRSHTPYDYLYIDETTTLMDLQKYELLVYPHAVIVTTTMAELLEQYVAAGGKLILGCRTGYKDEHGRCVMMKLPGLLQELAGTDVVEYSLAAPEDGKMYVDWDGEKIEAAVFHDLLEPIGENAKVLASYQSSYYAGETALIHNRYGKGEVYYYGAAFSEDTAALFLKKTGVAEPYGNLITLPSTCELAVRTKEGEKYYFVLNYKAENAEIYLHENMYSLFEDIMVDGKVTLEPYGVRVYKR